VLVLKVFSFWSL